MQRTVEILLVIGILVNLIKGADLILRPHQQKWLQNRFDTLALRLDYAKPLKWYTGLVHNRIYGVLFFAAPLLIIAAPLIPSVVKTGTAPLWWAIMMYALILFVVIGCVVAACEKVNLIDDFSSQRPPAWDVVSLVHYWLTSPKSLTQQLIRHLIIVATSVGLWLLISSTKTNVFGKGGVLIEVLNGIVFIVFALHTWIFAASSFCIIIFSLSLLLAEILLKLLRGLIWRIAEYNKGAFAAIVLILTAALGVTEYYIRFRNPPTPPVAPVTAPAQTPSSQPSTSPSP